MAQYGVPKVPEYGSLGLLRAKWTALAVPTTLVLMLVQWRRAIVLCEFWAGPKGPFRRVT